MSQILTFTDTVTSSTGLSYRRGVNHFRRFWTQPGTIPETHTETHTNHVTTRTDLSLESERVTHRDGPSCQVIFPLWGQNGPTDSSIKKTCAKSAHVANRKKIRYACAAPESPLAAHFFAQHGQLLIHSHSDFLL
jgi:hypothetical protein